MYKRQVLQWQNERSSRYFWYLKNILGRPDIVDNKKDGYAIWKENKLKNTKLTSIELRDNDLLPLIYGVNPISEPVATRILPESFFDKITGNLVISGNTPSDIWYKIWQILGNDSSSPLCSSPQGTECVNINEVLSDTTLQIQ